MLCPFFGFITDLSVTHVLFFRCQVCNDVMSVIDDKKSRNAWNRATMIRLYAKRGGCYNPE